MKKLMEDDLKSLDLIGDVVRKSVDLPVARPACWHNPLRDSNASGVRVPENLKLDYRTQPQRIKDFFINLFTRTLATRLRD